MSEINENEQEIDDSGEIQMLLRILSFLAANKKLRNFIDKENPPPIVPNIGVGVLSYTICEMLLVSLFTWLTEILGKGLLLRSCLKTPCRPPQGSSKRSVRRAFFIG